MKTTYTQLMATAPKLDPEPPATFKELLDADKLDVQLETDWLRGLAARVRAGEVSVDDAIDAAAMHGANRGYNAEERRNRYYSRPPPPLQPRQVVE